MENSTPLSNAACSLLFLSHILKLSHQKLHYLYFDIMPGKRKRQNTIEGSRGLAEDGLPVSDLKIYVNSLILRKPIEHDDNGKVTKVLYSCSQLGCKASWRQKAEITATSNYRRHYQKYHKKIAIDDEVPPEAESQVRARPRLIVDFWSKATAEVSYKRGNAVKFDPNVFIRLLINFVISNSLALRIVESLTFQRLIEYCIAKASMSSR
jgi:hypothetical protein